MAERSIEQEVRCPCGQGSILVERIDYNKMWVPEDIETSFTCRVCDERYSIHQHPPRTGGFRLTLKAETQAWHERLGRFNQLRYDFRREYIEPVVSRLIAMARAAEKGAQGKRRAWHATFQPWARALNLPAAEEITRLETFVSARVGENNVAELAASLGLNAGLTERLAELRAAEHAAGSQPEDVIWQGAPMG
ncbi:hypothetical protein WME94_34440 [Sorangium sp. So ce429]